MTRSIESLEKRKIKRKKKIADRKRNLRNALKNEIQEKGQIEKELASVKKQIKVIKNHPKPEIPLVTSVSRSRCQNKTNTVLSGGPAVLTTDVVLVSDKKISEGTFGIVNLGKVLNLNMKCAVKSGKTVHLFDAIH